MSARSASKIVRKLSRRDGRLSAATRPVPEEVAVAFSYGGTTHAVMMATPKDLEDFAFGFSLTEGIITAPSQIESIDILAMDQGYDVQVTLLDAQADALRVRRRHMAGPVGCGLCGIESIEQAVRPVPDVLGGNLRVSADQITAAVLALNEHQPIYHETRAVHGAGFYVPGEGLLAVREDVGRHNALDKLAGAVLRSGRAGADGIVVVTSRVSVEMVQKTAILGSPVLAAVSAPTALALDTAENAGMTVIALVRGDDFEIFTRPDRVDIDGFASGKDI